MGENFLVRQPRARGDEPTPEQTLVKLTATDAAAGEGFGASVASSGGVIAIGAPGGGTGRTNGKVYVFERADGEWMQQAILTAGDGQAGDQFGYSVSVSGARIGVGSPGDDDGGFASGSTYLFERNEGGTGEWRQTAKLSPSKPAPTRQFGQSISISGDRLVVGQQLDDDSGRSPGSAYVFEMEAGEGSQWREAATVSAPDATRSNAFGSAVAISEDLLLVGAFGDQDGGLAAGSAYVFERSRGDQPWGHVEKLKAADPKAGDNFAISVSVSEGRAVAGSPFDDDKADGSGSAHVFEQDEGGESRWGRAAKLTAHDAATLDNFGKSVALKENCIAVGAPQDDDGGNNAGSVYVFARGGAEAEKWRFATKLTAPDAGAGTASAPPSRSATDSASQERRSRMAPPATLVPLTWDN